MLNQATESRSAAPQTTTSGQGPPPPGPQNVQSAVVRLIDPRETLIPMLEGLSRALGYARGVVALYDPAGAALRGIVGLNVPEPIAQSLEVPLAQVDNPLIIALREGVPPRVDDVRVEPSLRDHLQGLFLEMEITSFAVVPLPSTT